MEPVTAISLTILGIVILPLAIIVGGIIVATGRSKISKQEALQIRQRLDALEERMDTLTQAGVGSPVITTKDATEIAQEAARIQAAQAQQQKI